MFSAQFLLLLPLCIHSSTKYVIMDPEWTPERDMSSTLDLEMPDGVQTQAKPRRATRTRAACQRCQRRKIKCDGATPVCSSCKKAGTTCLESGKPQEYPKAYISSLKDRIQWLESVISSRCPDVDLNEAPRVIGYNGTERGDSPASINNAQYSLDTSNNRQPTSENGVSATNTERQAPIVEEAQPERLAHEIGLVSVTGGQDLRYVGPSSGYFFAKLVLASAGRQGRRRPAIQRQDVDPISALSRESFQVPPAPLPSSMDQAIRLSSAYWDTIHSEYPFLHQPSHLKLIEHMYSAEEPRPIAAFQVNMVLAISATILSRRLKVHLTAEGFCAAAMTHFEAIPIEGSLEGLQSLLLLQMYALNNPSMGLNAWYLNYQCIANILDLGLQRDIRAGNNVSLLTQEMRTRIFWVVYSVDRTLATIMGRPIGLRDEACELRMPQDKEDSQLSDSSINSRENNSPPTAITNAIHLMKLAKLNSEIKIPDVGEWQQDILNRLQQWSTEIPQFQHAKRFMTKSCEIKYHEVMLLLLLPSPAIPNPSQDSLRLCNKSAISIIRAFDEMYRGDVLVYSWPTVHSVFLATITMLYCIWVVPGVAKETKLDVLMADLKAGSNVLSATAEHWTEAKRSRDVLDELSGATIRWITETQTRSPARQRQQIASSDAYQDQPGIEQFSAPGGFYEAPQGQDYSNLPLSSMDEYLSPDTFTSIFGTHAQLDGQNSIDINSIMQGVFSDYQVPVDFGQDFMFDGQM
ncbi:hypothetical protein PVAG01_00253 [Phlyctema vagabunda]|uniref:Zn(2)-C6 fungal-type domain-containing protein n=1 Tax=Phlyctema vagabunda TaxID=108571 RepID=A0ABR4PTZ9_9HELO